MNHIGRLKRSLIIVSGGMSCSFVSLSKCDQSDQPERYVAISLATKSQNDLKEYLDKQQVGSLSGNLVIIKPLSENLEDQYAYEPLFGERAAFRLKGITKTKNGLTVGFGRVSTFVGEVKEDGESAALIPTIPLAISESELNSSLVNESLEHMMGLISNDFLTELSSASTSSDSLMSNHHNTDTLKSTGTIIFPFSQQIVLEGRICRSDLFDVDGSCLFDRSQIQPTKVLSSSSSSSISSSNGSPADNATTTEEVSECPVCKFMKNGECKEEFLKWDECVSALKENEDVGKCFDVTVAMMKCMKRYEYYDIMTAGTKHHTD